MSGYIKTMGVLFLSLFSGCCPCPPRNVGPLPAPITPEEQSRRLTEWSRQLPLIKARTVVTGVRLDYRDDKGQGHSVNAEGLLQIQQHPMDAQTATTPPADVLLLGTAFDQPAFEAGRNEKFWWFAIRLDTKKAWVGDSTRPLDTATLAGKDSASILRADLVPDLLALSPLPPTDVSSNKQSTVLRMLVNDDAGTNDLFVIGLFGGYFMREIIVDRCTGRVSEVRFYDVDGKIVVRSQLGDYAPVTYADGVEKATTVPWFPRKVVVSYPGQFLTVSLQFDEVRLVPEFKPAVFLTPDFEKQGLRLIPAD